VAIKKILIVDDSPTERYYLTDILVKNGFTVTTADNGEEALARIKADKPELILMDVVMPGANGFQVTRSIARDPELADVPIIICSSKNQETDRIWGLRQGARDYLIKPVDPQQLLDKIASLGAGAA
jgi:twitching motility two-component system response regulator PilH